MSFQCPQCHSENRDGARFCNRCGMSFTGQLGNRSSSTPWPAVSSQPVMAHPGQTGMLPPNSMLANRYLITQKIGRGGMAAVYDAADTRTNRRVAIKEMSDSMIVDPEERELALAQFNREAQLLARLEHPNLPKVSDIFEFGGKHYLVMDFIDGYTLEDAMNRTGGTLPEAQVAHWAVQLCDVLNYLHQQDPPIIFRDLKPSNVMIDRNRQVKLIDFGIARLFKAEKKRDTMMLGTIGYAAPEQHGTAQSDARTDIYAMGVTLHHALTGFDPAHSPMNLPPIQQLNAAISPEMARIITRALEHDPGKRWQNAIDIKKALTTKLGTGPTPTVAVTPPPPRPIPTQVAPPYAGLAPQPIPPKKVSRPTTRLLMMVAQWSGPQIALALGGMLVLFVAGIWFGSPILIQYPMIWNNMAFFAIIGPLAYSAVRKKWIAGGVHIVLTMIGVVIAGLRTAPNNPEQWKLLYTAIGAVLSGALIETCIRLLPKIRGQNRDEAWQRELAWLSGMSVGSTILHTIVAWGIAWITSPLLWISAAVFGALGWFLGDLAQQYMVYKQTGIKRGIGGR